MYASEMTVPPRSGVDATAHIGSDSIWFKYLYPQLALTAVELAAPTCELLRHNMLQMPRVLRQDPKLIEPPVTVVQGSCVDYLAGRIEVAADTNPRKRAADGVSMATPRVDFVYFDPPWGGPAFKHAGHKVTLSLGDQSLGCVVGKALARGNAPLIIVKAPPNMDIAAFRRDMELQLSPKTDTVLTRRCTLKGHVITKVTGNYKGKISYRLLFARIKDASTGAPSVENTQT